MSAIDACDEEHDCIGVMFRIVSEDVNDYIYEHKYFVSYSKFPIPIERLNIYKGKKASRIWLKK